MMYNEITEDSKTVPTKTIPTNFNGKEVTFTTRNFYILLAFLLVTIALLTAVSVYCFHIKQKSKQNHLLPYRDTNSLETDVKNFTCLHFDDIMRIKDFEEYIIR